VCISACSFVRQPCPTVYTPYSTQLDFTPDHSFRQEFASVALVAWLIRSPVYPIGVALRRGEGRCGCRALVAVWDGISSRHLESKRLTEIWGGGVASLSFSPSLRNREIYFSGAFFCWREVIYRGCCLREGFFLHRRDKKPLEVVGHWSGIHGSSLACDLLI